MSRARGGWQRRRLRRALRGVRRAIRSARKLLRAIRAALAALWFLLFAGRAADSRYSMRAIGSRSVRYASFSCEERSSERLRSSSVARTKLSGMQLPAQLVKLLFEQRRIDRQFLRPAEKREIVRAWRQRLNFAARRRKNAPPADGQPCSSSNTRLWMGCDLSFRHTHANSLAAGCWSSNGPDGLRFANAPGLSEPPPGRNSRR